MQDGEIYLLFTEPLDRLGLAHVVTGSVASSSYGEPRFTHDIDLILSLPTTSIDSLSNVFPVDRFYCPPAETLRIEAGRPKDGHFNLVHHETGFKADVYVAGKDELMAWALEKRRIIEILPGRSIALAPPEYVIVAKLQFFTEGGGERHIRDIQGVLDVSGDDLALGLVEDWVHRLGLEEAWRNLRTG